MSRSRRREKIPKPREDVEELSDDWDVLIVSDGSALRCCGWAARLRDPELGVEKTFWGAWSYGDSALAELLPCWQALRWYADTLQRRGLSCDLRITLVVDSKTLARQGQRIVRRRNNLDVWAAIETLEGLGFRLDWRWQPRGYLGLNCKMDKLSRKSREALEAVDPRR